MGRSILSYINKVDNIDDVLASHVNLLQTNQEKIWNTLAFVEATELTIAAGVVTATQNYHTIDTEADAATDNLDTITISGNICEGSILILRPDHTDRTIVIRHNQGNILCNGDANITLDDSHDFGFLIYDETLVKWMAFSGGLANIAEDTTPQLGGDLDTNDFHLVIKTPTADVTGMGIIRTLTVDTNAEGIGAPLFMAADEHLDTADADAVASMPCIALALETGIGAKKVLLWGTIRVDAWNWTIGPGELSLIYVSTTVGTLTQTKPTGADDVIQPVGWAISADEMMFMPSMMWITHTG